MAAMYLTKKQLRKLAATFLAGCLMVLWLRLEQDASSVDAMPPTGVGGIQETDPRLPGNDISTSTNALVVRAVDGDTLEVRLDGDEDAVTVRLLGVNTPETVDPRRPVECFGKEASAFTKTMTAQRRVRLEDDPEADEIDKYGRLLRNVVLEDGTDLNAELVSRGYAYAYVSFPLTPSRKAELIRLESEARTAARGLWNPEACPTSNN